MNIIFLVVEKSAGENFFEIGLENAVLSGVVTHQGLPVFTLHRAAFVRTHEGSSGGQRGFNAVLESITMKHDEQQRSNLSQSCHVSIFNEAGIFFWSILFFRIPIPGRTMSLHRAHWWKKTDPGVGENPQTNRRGQRDSPFQTGN